MMEHDQNTLADQQLLDRIRQKDAMAIDSLIRRYASLVYGVAMRRTRYDAQLAADVSQAVFIVFMRRVDSIRSAHSLPSWFHKTTCLAVRDAQRAANRRAHHETSAARPEETMRSTPSLDTTANLELIDLAINSLSKSDRNLVLMRYLQEREIAEIALQAGVEEATMRKRLARAVERMRNHFASQGVALSGARISELLQTAGHAAVPASVVQASIHAAAATGASSAMALIIAGKVAKAIAWSQAKLIAWAAAAVIVVAGTAIALQLQSTPANPGNGSTPASVAQTKQEAFKELGAIYALAPGQSMRVIKAPFPAVRNAWVEAEYPRAGGARNVRSLNFRWSKAGELEPWAMSYPGVSLNSIITTTFRFPWFKVQGLNQVKWNELQADIVIDEVATEDQKMTALAELISREAGQQVKFVKTTRLRPCIVLKQAPTSQGYRNSRQFDVLILTQELVDGGKIARWSENDRPAGSTNAFEFQSAARHLDAPFIADAGRGEPDISGDDTPRISSLIYILPDAKLNSSDPQYETKLRKILDNVQTQVGGIWAIERREVDVYELKPNDE